MTLGELYDALWLIKDAEADIANAEKSLRFGGNDDTMSHKQDMLSRARQTLLDRRDRELPSVYIEE